MDDCKHEHLEYQGDQKTDAGVNSYYRCKSCGMLLVLTPTGKVIGVKGVQPGRPPQVKRGSKS
ncbi:MAG TPA: hypothetical protein VLU91_01725 [Nitrososphaerales archaeon]|nr:hypothetical protein [Nitrososphaerales archaeon]